MYSATARSATVLTVLAEVGISGDGEGHKRSQENSPRVWVMQSPICIRIPGSLFTVLHPFACGALPFQSLPLYVWERTRQGLEHTIEQVKC